MTQDSFDERLVWLLQVSRSMLATRDLDRLLTLITDAFIEVTEGDRGFLMLQDRTTGVLTELLQAGRIRGELRREVDVLAAARTIEFVTTGARIAWANGLLDAEGCRASIALAVELLFRGIEAPESARST